MPATFTFKYKGKEPKNFGRFELVQPGAVVIANEGKEADGLRDHPEFEEIKADDKKPAK